MFPGVLIFTFDNLPGSGDPREKGGVERFSLRLSDSLSGEFRFFFAYSHEVDRKHYIEGDLDVAKSGAEGLRKFIAENHISLVHLQQYSEDTLAFFQTLSREPDAQCLRPTTSGRTPTYRSTPGTAASGGCAGSSRSDGSSSG